MRLEDIERRLHCDPIPSNYADLQWLCEEVRRLRAALEEAAEALDEADCKLAASIVRMRISR